MAKYFAYIFNFRIKFRADLALPCNLLITTYIPQFLGFLTSFAFNSFTNLIHNLKNFPEFSLWKLHFTEGHILPDHDFCPRLFPLVTTFFTSQSAFRLKPGQRMMENCRNAKTQISIVKSYFHKNFDEFYKKNDKKCSGRRYHHKFLIQWWK